MRRKLSVVMPCYNEEASVAAVVAAVQAVDLGDVEREIIAVDDGSGDRTAEILSALPGIRVIVHERNRGKGAAVKSGFAAATGDILLIQDADLEYDPSDHPAVIAAIVRGSADFVMGSRFVNERPVFFFGKRRSPFFTHYIGNRLIIALTNVLYGQSATDYEGAFKAFRRDVVTDLRIEADGFEYDNELVCRLLRRGRRMVEVPISYRPRGYEQGKKIKWRDGITMLWTIIRWRFRPA